MVNRLSTLILEEQEEEEEASTGPIDAALGVGRIDQ